MMLPFAIATWGSSGPLNSLRREGPLPSLRQLEYLVELARQRHFRRAAESLGISQPTLSAQLRAMEERLGLELVERSRSSVIITPAGQRVVEIARRMLQGQQEILDLARTGNAPLGGVIRLGLPSTIGPNLLPLILPDLHRKHPDLALQVREDVPRKLPEALASGLHDFLLVPLPIVGPDLVTTPIFREPVFAAMAEDHPLAAKDRLRRQDLRGQDVLSLERGHQLQEQVVAICEEAGARLALDFEGTSLDTLSQMVAMGTGVTFLPGLYVDRTTRDQGGIAIRELSGRALSRTIGAAWRSSSAREDDYRLLTDFIRTAVSRAFPAYVLL